MIPRVFTSMKLTKVCWFVGLFLSLSFCSLAKAGALLEAVKKRDLLRCGVSEGIPGFSEQDAKGDWRGLDADFCRAVAAAVLGDAAKVEFIPLKASTRFPALQSRAIDLLVRNTTWSFTREVLLKVQFPAVLFYDGQGFLVPSASGITQPTQLQEAKICVEKGTNHLRNLEDYGAAHGLRWQPLVMDSARETAEAFFSGRCQAYSSDASQLVAVRLWAPSGPDAFRILPERISKEPLGPAVLGGDQDWISLVRWVFYALVLAEETGVTANTIETKLAEGRGSLSRLSQDEKKLLARNLGVTPGWAVRAIKAVGNYGELYDRHFGQRTPLAIERGPNRLWRDGGLIYAPPID